MRLTFTRGVLIICSVHYNFPRSIFKRTAKPICRKPQGIAAVTIIEIRPFRNGWQVYERAGVQPVFLKQEQASESRRRSCLRIICMTLSRQSLFTPFSPEENRDDRN